MFGSRIRLKSLAVVCRTLSTMLHSGVDIKKAFRIAADKSSDPRVREALSSVQLAIRQGEDVSTAMRATGAFPELMIDMIDVAEQTGALPEVLDGLSRHYENNVRLRKEFLRGIAFPVFQLTAAIFVIALVILILGFIAEFQNRSEEEVDVLGWGLVGVDGVVIWFTYTFGTALALFVGYQMLRRSLQGQQFLDPLLMRIPVLGHCMRSFAMARFSWAFALTQQSGMPIQHSLSSSLRATSNGAFVGATPQICGDVMEGDFLGDALARSKLFPREFLEIVRVAETSGTVPEALERLSPQFEEDARRSLQALTATMSWLVWLLVAAFIIFVVFSLFMFYVGALNDALRNV